LASNSLLEALVYAHNIFKYHNTHSIESVDVTIPKWNDQGISSPNELKLIQYNLKQLQTLMQDYVGIVRSNYRLTKAILCLNLIYKEVEDLYENSKVNTSLCELRNMINVAHLIIGQSLERKENRGGYFNCDNLNVVEEKKV
jgi:L-aspartate oxidase